MNTKLAKSGQKPMQHYYQTNHTYFREFFQETTDIYYLRIVDQMAQINQETNIVSSTVHATEFDLISQEVLYLFNMTANQMKAKLGRYPKSLKEM